MKVIRKTGIILLAFFIISSSNLHFNDNANFGKVSAASQWELVSVTPKEIFEIDNTKYIYRAKYLGILTSGSYGRLNFNGITFNTSEIHAGAANDYYYVNVPNGSYKNINDGTSYFRIERIQITGQWELVTDIPHEVFTIDNDSYIYRADYKGLLNSGSAAYFTFETVSYDSLVTFNRSNAVITHTNNVVVQIENGSYRNLHNSSVFTGRAYYSIYRLKTNSSPILNILTLDNQVLFSNKYRI